MRTMLVSAAALVLGLAFGASADMWDDYSPSKSPWTVTQVKVQPGKIDEYLAGLKQSWVSEMEVQKKAGLVTDYRILVNTVDRAPGANVILMIQWADWSALEPNKDRDLKIRAEIEKALPKAKGDAMVAGYNQYRTFVDDGAYMSIEFPK